MPTTDREVPQVVVNKLTQAQYNSATKSQDEFYLVTDAKVTSDDIDLNTFRTVLYNDASGTTGNVTLSESLANFTMIRIFFRSSDDNYSSIDVFGPNGKYIMLSLSNMTSSGGWIKIKRMQCSGTTMTVDSGNSGQISLPSTWSTGGSYIYVTRVEGWKI